MSQIPFGVPHPDMETILRWTLPDPQDRFLENETAVSALSTIDNVVTPLFSSIVSGLSDTGSGVGLGCLKWPFYMLEMN